MVMRYQPQGLVRPAATPLRRGLVAALPLSSFAYRDAADSATWAPTGPVALGTGPRGIGLRTKGATAQYVSRTIPAGLPTATTQPVSFRYRLLLNAMPATAAALMSWGNIAQDGAPRHYARVSSAGVLNLYIASGYRPSGTITIGRECIVTYVFDGTNHYAYIDGVQTSVTPGVQTNNAGSFFLGIGFDGAIATTDFVISDFALWNRALSVAEVVSDAQNPYALYADPYEDDESVASVAPTSITSSLAWAEAGDSAALAATIKNSTSLAWSEAGDGATLAVVVTDSGALAWTEDGDVAAIAATAINRAALAWAESGDSASLVGAVNNPTPSGIYGPLAWTEAGDSATLAVRLTDLVTISYAEQGDTCLITGISVLPPIINISYVFRPLKSDKFSVVHLSS